jgi:signal transduction histidine kinase
VARLPPLARVRTLEPWYTSVVDTLGPEPEVVYLALRRDPDGTPQAAYGFAVRLDDVGRTVLRPLLDRVGLLPLALPSAIPNDSVLSVSILQPGGARALELSPRRHPPVYAASIPASRFLGNWTLHLALDPVAAPPILIGGLPPSRGLPLALLVLVTGALVGVTLVAARRAFELARLRADFVASVSHELRTPLAQIQLFGESLALGRMRSRGDVRDAGRVIVGEARRLLQMVENVILFNRSGRPHAAPFVVQPLAPLVRETVESFTPLAVASAARLRTVRLDEVTAPIDRGALRQVLLNLLDNAAKYGPRGGTISVGLARLDGRARIWVEDEGPGIPAADRERVWEPFLRLPRDVESHAAGSGIGLALVRELVGRHRGSAWIEPAPGGGACVVVELPEASCES